MSEHDLAGLPITHEDDVATCRTCKFFNKYTQFIMGTQPLVPLGQCRCVAPIRGPTGGAEWPTVAADMCCGQHKVKS